MSGRSGGVRTALWLRLVLRLYPAAFRRAHTAEVLEFVERDRASREGGSLAVRIRWRLRAFLDLMRGAARAWRAEWRRGARAGELSPVFAGRAPGERLVDGFATVFRAARSLWRVPLFALTVVVTVALGVGLSSAMFSVLNAVVLRPLDYRESDRLVRVTSTISEATEVLLAGRTVEKMNERVHTFDGIAGVATIRQNLTGTDVPRQVEVGWTSTNFFEVLGVGAALGRTYRAGDPMGTAVLSDRSWRRDFGADPGVLGRTVQLDGSTYTVVGVLPARFRLHLDAVPRVVDVWKVPDNWWQNGDVWSADGKEFGLLRAVGRLSAGADLVAAQSDLDRVAAGLREEIPQYATDDFELSAAPLHGQVVGRARPLLTLLMAAVIAVVLIVCANVTGLLLVRAEDRQHEMAVRLALGSGRGRIVSHLMAESFVMAGAGGVLGLGVAFATMRVLPQFAPADVPRIGDVSMDGSVLAFGLAATVTCMLLFGLVPAFTVAKRSARRVLASARVSRSAGRARGVLVVAQICASMVLLVAAALFATSMDRLQAVEPGFDAEDVLTFAVSLPGTRYDWPEGASRFYQRLVDRIEDVPGVESASMLWPLPLAGSWSGEVRGGGLAEADRHLARYDLITPGMFETLRIPLIEGRTFESNEPRTAVLVSRSLAEKAWPGESALGRQLRVFPWGQDTIPFSVVGVVDDVRFESLRQPPSDVVYFANSGWVWTDWEVNVAVRSNNDPSALIGSIRTVLADMDPLIPVADVRPLASYLEAEAATLQFARMLFGLFAAVAVFLAVLGLYGVVAYGVRCRHREFGIRMALGSRNGAILGLVFRHGLILAAAGIMTGSLAAFWASGLLRATLFGVTNTEPVVYVIAAASLAMAAIAASIVPALSVTRVDPVTVLRPE